MKNQRERGARARRELAAMIQDLIQAHEDAATTDLDPMEDAVVGFEVVYDDVSGLLEDLNDTLGA